jgi:hypothetical protein
VGAGCVVLLAPVLTTTAMIDLNLYRFRIGVFSQCKFKAAGKSGCNVAPTLGGISNICLMGYIFYIFIMSCIY